MENKNYIKPLYVNMIIPGGRTTYIRNGSNPISKIKQVKIRIDEIDCNNDFMLLSENSFKWYGIPITIDNMLEENQVYIKLFNLKENKDIEGFTTTDYFYYLLNDLYAKIY